MRVCRERVNDEDRVTEILVGGSPRFIGDSCPWEHTTRFQRKVANLRESTVTRVVAVAPRTRYGRRTERPRTDFGYERRRHGLFGCLPIHGVPIFSREKSAGPSDNSPGPAVEGVLLRFACCGEALFEIGDDVVDVLESDRESNEARGDSRRQLLLRGQLRVRC